MEKKKKIRWDIDSLDALKKCAREENYLLNFNGDKSVEREISENFNITLSLAVVIVENLNRENIKFRVDGIEDFIKYNERIVEHREKIDEIFRKIQEFDFLYIDRVEFERIITFREDVDEIIKKVEGIKDRISFEITKEESMKIESLEEGLDQNYIYSKDIEILKKLIIDNNVRESYREDINLKTLKIKIPKNVNKDYIPVRIGTVEYHNHLKQNLIRIERLLRNLDKYIIKEEKYIIHQSEALQDTINIAIASYNGKEFKAISGKNNIEGYCPLVRVEEGCFKSSQVDKKGELGVGYNRINDSEKKILEAIDKKIKKGELIDSGNLIIYTKWEPCFSCYSVISQFIEKYPKIEVIVKYNKNYGKKN